MDDSLPGSSVHGILQVRILERVAIPCSRGSFQPSDRTWVSCTAGRLFTVWATREAPILVYWGQFFLSDRAAASVSRLGLLRQPQGPRLLLSHCSSTPRPWPSSPGARTANQQPCSSPWEEGQVRKGSACFLPKELNWGVAEITHPHPMLWI